MDGAETRDDGFSPGGMNDSAARAAALRQKADWCVGMAAKVADPGLFRTYVEAAAVYQQEAAAIEGRLGVIRVTWN